MPKQSAKLGHNLKKNKSLDNIICKYGLLGTPASPEYPSCNSSLMRHLKL